MNLQKDGFDIVENIYSKKELDVIIEQLDALEFGNQFGYRTFLHQHKPIARLLFSDKLKALIHKVNPNCRYSIKSIYFNKPQIANWIVNWHQDLTINVTNKKEILGYINWRNLKDRTVVQPDLQLLENIFTLRIHLDDCTKENGALRVVKGSHKNGVIPIKEWMESNGDEETICEVNKGGVLVMKPLILHASRRTENQKNRRVIHIEFSDKALPNGLEWKEKYNFND